MRVAHDSTAALLECPVCCRLFPAQTPAPAYRAACPNCGAHYLAYEALAAVFAVRDAEERNRKRPSCACPRNAR